TVLTYFFGKRLFCTEGGLVAALILCSSLMFDLIARAATPDSYLVFFMTLALYAFTFGGLGAVSGLATNNSTSVESNLTTVRFPSWRVAVVIYTAMALAMLVKGPIGVLLPMAAVGLYLLCTTPLKPLPSVATWHERWLRRLTPFGPSNFLR